MAYSRWSEDNTYKFVSEYVKCRSIWDLQDENYRDKRYRQAALRKLAGGMGIEGFGWKEVRIKIRNLKSTYYQELKKMKQRRERGSQYFPSLKWFGLLYNAFNPIPDSTSSVDEQDMITIKPSSSPLSTYENSNMTEFSNCEQIQEETDIFASKISEEHFQQHEDQPPAKRKASNDNCDDLITLIDKRLSKKSNDKLESASTYWVSILRSLPESQQICAIKMINEVLFEAQFGNLNRNTKLLCYTQPDLVNGVLKKS